MMDMLVTAMVASNWVLGLYVLLRSGAPEESAVLKVSASAPVFRLRRAPLRLAAA